MEYKGYIIYVNEIKGNPKEHRYRATTTMSKGENPVKYGETKEDAISHIKQYIDMSINWSTKK